MNIVQPALFTPSQNIMDDTVYFFKFISVLKVLFLMIWSWLKANSFGFLKQWWNWKNIDRN
jgi:hypothetical protein